MSKLTFVEDHSFDEHASADSTGSDNEAAPHHTSAGRVVTSYDLFDLSRNEGRKGCEVAVSQYILPTAARGEKRKREALATALSADNEEGEERESGSGESASRQQQEDDDCDEEEGGEGGEETIDGDSTAKKKKKRKKKNRKKNKRELLTQTTGDDANLAQLQEGMAADSNALSAAVPPPTTTPPSSSSSSSSSSHLASTVEATHQPVYSRPSLSSFLTKFLSTKRDCNSVPEPESIELGSTEYLASFYASAEGEEDAASVQSADSETDRSAVATDEHSNDLLLLDDPSSSSSAAALLEDSPSIAYVNLYNLPFVATADDIRKLVRKAGIQVRDVVLGGTNHPHPKSKGLLAGMALLEVLLAPSPAASSANEASSLLHGLEMGGRVLRAQVCGDRRKSLDTGRYFDGNISCKCTNCGQVGHLSAECTQPALPTPCHLCAGVDHDSGECANIICFRCGRLGHHSRDCGHEATSRWQRPQICVHCASSRHESAFCSAYATYPQAMTGAALRCVVCYALGHTVCGPSAATMAAAESRSAEDLALFCPNCGLEGHHVDICRQCEAFQRCEVNLSYCEGAKHDAFFKYPTLSKELERLNGGDPNTLYRRILRSGNEMHLFPSLSSQPVNVHFRHSQSSYSSQSHSGRHVWPAEGRHSYGEMDRGRSRGSQEASPFHRRYSGQSRHVDDRDSYRRMDRRHSHEGYPRPAPAAGRPSREFEQRMENRKRRFS